MNGPKISVIVPVYNAERWLRRCIDSILAQTYSDFELLLIDDGSTDGSGAICDQYTDLNPRIHVFHKPNGGVSSARNLGLDKAKGEWICFIDSDDEISNLHAIDYADRNNDIILFTLRVIKPDGSSYVETHELDSDTANIKDNYLKAFLHYHIFNSACAKLIRKNIIGNQRFDTALNFGEDALFYLQLMESVNKIGICGSVEYIYHRNEDYEAKYVKSLELSISTMEQIFTAYHKLGVRNKIFERNVFNCYRGICREDWIRKPSLWNNNTSVKLVYKNIKDAYSFLFRLKYRLMTTSIYHICKFFSL